MFYDDEPEATRQDYNREAYGDPCPKHGTLRWQADCPDCEQEEQDAAEAERDQLTEAREEYEAAAARLAEGRL
jgi:hypothetical protein